VNAASTRTASAARPFDVPVLAEADTLRVVTRHDATAERRRHDLGFQEGYAEGCARAAVEVNAAIADHRRNAERLAALCQALDEAIEQTRDDAAIVALEDSVIDMALHIAEVLVHREVTEHDAVVDSIRHCLQLKPADSAVARVHPDDLACALEARDARLIEATSRVELVADPTVGRGGCVIETGSSQIDGQIGPALERIREALLPS
jgi:flagellar assembly protein FliH